MLLFDGYDCWLEIVTEFDHGRIDVFKIRRNIAYRFRLFRVDGFDSIPEFAWVAFIFDQNIYVIS